MDNGNKIVMLGDAMVGKTALVLRFTMGMFNPSQLSTIGAGSHEYLYTEDDTNYTIHIWDTAGSETYKSMTPIYARDAIGAIIVFDLTSFDTFKNIDEWRSFIDPSIPLIIVGNKSDLKGDRAVTFMDGINAASQRGIDYIETSAFTGEEVDSAFLRIIKLSLDNKKKKVMNIPRDIDLRKDAPKSGCC